MSMTHVNDMSSAVPCVSDLTRANQKHDVSVSVSLSIFDFDPENNKLFVGRAVGIAVTLMF